MARTTVSTSFQKRIIGLGLFMVVSMGLLGARLLDLTVERGSIYLDRAESRLARTTHLPTIRGSILDRKGRPLALERSSWNFAVDFEVITGAWQRRQAIKEARASIGRREWSNLSRSQRENAIAESLLEWNARVGLVWKQAEEGLGLNQADLTEQLHDIKRGVGALAVKVWDNQLERLIRKRGLSEEEAQEVFRQDPIAEQRGMHPIIEGLSDEQVFPLRKAIHELHARAEALGSGSDPAFKIQDTCTREHAYQDAVVEIDRSTLPAELRSDGVLRIQVGGLARTLVGTVRTQVHAEDVQRRPFRRESGQRDLSGYSPGRDIVGSTGVEYHHDAWLHGFVGVVTEDLAQKTVMETIRPIAGGDVRIALDVALQARIRAIMNPRLGLLRAQQWHYGWSNDGTAKPMLKAPGTDLAGAAVIVDVQSGEVLAMVSTPTPSDRPFTSDEKRLMALDRDAVAALGPEDVSRRRALLALAPYTNRSVETAYAPGSIVKPLMYVAGITEGVISHGQEIDCKGWYRCERCKPRCWTWRPEQKLFGYHGVLDPIEAITESCNIYFYTIAERLGSKRMQEWYARWGLGDDTVAGLPRAVRGQFIENNTEIGRLIFGIGQGSVAWTPLHAAIAYARLAGEGAGIEPRFVLDPVPAHAATAIPPREWNHLAVETALAGMRESVRSGTASEMRLQGRQREPLMDLADMPGGAPTVWAKTGTAQITNGASHGWYAGLVAPAGSETPRYAFAVIVEHGNSGAPSAGPVAHQLVRQLAAEGYLGRQAASGATPVQWIGDGEAGP